MEQEPAEHELHPPPAPEMGMAPPPGPLDTAENIDSFLLAGFLHSGHLTDLSASLNEHLRSKVMPQPGQLYSYIGITIIF